MKEKLEKLLIRIRPICKGINVNGELLWDYERMGLWQELQLFRKQYQGDFCEQWMWACLREKSALEWGD